jgi:branched-chain amino acid transport system ATP-binding protein
VLTISDLRVSYGRIPALHGIALEVEAGELVGLIGANGAGKTTTLNTIMGLLAPSEGSIRFQGESIAGWAPERVARAGIALVPEGRQIFATLSVAENLSLGLTGRGAGGAGARADVDRWLDRFPVLREYYRKPAGQLSGGEQQQLAIARALLQRPKLLLLDEPSLGLAPQVVDLVFEVLGELREEGATILLVEQNAARTLAVADRTYLMRTGRIALEGDRATLLDSPDVTSVYLGLEAHS